MRLSTLGYTFFIGLLAIGTRGTAVAQLAPNETEFEYSCITGHYGPRQLENPYELDQFQLKQPKPCPTGYSFLGGGFVHFPGAVRCTVKAGQESCTAVVKRHLYPLSSFDGGKVTLSSELTSEEKKLGCVLSEAGSWASIDCWEDLSHCSITAVYRYGCSGSPKRTETETSK